jgi:hypothetical protein
MSAIAISALRVSLATLTFGQLLGNTEAHHWRKLMKQLLNRYRPELHYMRGPGPKWREKHALNVPHPRGDRRPERINAVDAKWF